VYSFAGLVQKCLNMVIPIFKISVLFLMKKKPEHFDIWRFAIANQSSKYLRERCNASVPADTTMGDFMFCLDLSFKLKF